MGYSVPSLRTTRVSIRSAEWSSDTCMRPRRFLAFTVLFVGYMRVFMKPLRHFDRYALKRRREDETFRCLKVGNRAQLFHASRASSIYGILSQVRSIPVISRPASSFISFVLTHYTHAHTAVRSTTARHFHALFTRQLLLKLMRGWPNGM